MIDLLPRRATAVWLLLMVLTAATSWFGTGHAVPGLGADSGPALVLVGAFVKAWLVGREFMEIRTAPRSLRVVFSFWIVGFGASTTYLFVS